MYICHLISIIAIFRTTSDSVQRQRSIAVGELWVADEPILGVVVIVGVNPLCAPWSLLADELAVIGRGHVIDEIRGQVAVKVLVLTVASCKRTMVDGFQ